MNKECNDCKHLHFYFGKHLTSFPSDVATYALSLFLVLAPCYKIAFRPLLSSLGHG